MARAVFQLPSTQIPTKGPAGVMVPFAFTAAAPNISGDLMLEQQTGNIDFVQSIFIDNRFNAQPFTITFQGLQYTIQCRAGRQGIFPVLCAPGTVQFSANSPVAASIVIPTIMMNIQQPYFTWDI